MLSILCSNARAPVAQLVRASDRNSEDPGLNPGWISMSFFTTIKPVVDSLTQDSIEKANIMYVTMHANLLDTQLEQSLLQGFYISCPM